MCTLLYQDSNVFVTIIFCLLMIESTRPTFKKINYVLSAHFDIVLVCISVMKFNKTIVIPEMYYNIDGLQTVRRTVVSILENIL